jgi:hypothetical protein
MQQTTISFEPLAQGGQRLGYLRSTAMRAWCAASSWLDQKSELYSRICEFTVTRRLVIRINLVSLCLTGAAVAVEQQPLFSTIAIACAAWLVYRLNKSEKEGGEK